jgi:acetylglutamate kinase
MKACSEAPAMKLVIKAGGTLLDDPAVLAEIARQLAALSRVHQLVIVHGGGKQVTHYLAERGIESRFVNGLRVSSAPVIDAVLKVIAGTVNKRLVSALVAAGAPALGLSGVDGPLTIAQPLDPALGFVGQPGPTDPRLLESLLSAGYTPVIACVAGDRSGNIYNVNADQMAVSCATGWGAQKLLFLTDVPGVQDQAGRVLPHLATAEIPALLASGIVRGGMQAKLQAAAAAVAAGVEQVIVACGHEPDVCAKLLAGHALGTRVSPHPCSPHPCSERGVTA